MAAGTSTQIDLELARLPEAAGFDPELVARTASFVDFVRTRCRDPLRIVACVEDCAEALVDLARDVLPGAPAAVFVIDDDRREPTAVHGGPPTTVEALRQWLMRSPPKDDSGPSSALVRLACIGEHSPIFSHPLGPASHGGGRLHFVVEAPTRRSDLHPEIRLLGLAASALQDGLELRVLSNRVTAAEQHAREVDAAHRETRRSLDSLRTAEDESPRLRMAESEPRPFDLAVLVEEQVGFVAAHGDPGGVELVARYAPEAPRRFVGDAGALRSIIRHLLHNGLVTTKQGHVVVRVDCAAQVAGSARMCITVDDTGCGYTDIELEAIFEASLCGEACEVLDLGERVDGTEPARLLARIREELACFGGDLGGTSHPGEGSTFFATLDLEEAR